MAIFHHKVARFVVLMLVALMTCMMPGCLRYQTRKMAKYDRKTDSFAILCIYHDFYAEDKKDIEHLNNIWKVRSSLLAGLPSFSLFSGETKIRVSNSEYKKFNLSDPEDLSDKIFTTKVPLNTITIKPGDFFKTKENRLAYYHQMTLPGKTFDSFLEEIRKPFNAEVLKEIEKTEKKLKEGVRPISWKEARAFILKEVEQDEKKDKEKPDNTEKEKTTAPLSPKSLAMLTQQAKEEKLAFTRKGTTLTITLEMTEEDCRETVVTFEYFKEQTEARRKRGQTVQLPENLFQLFSVRSDQPGQLTISIDALLLFEGSSTEPGEEKPDYSKAVEFVKKQGIPLRTDLSIEKIVKEFNDAE